MCIMYHGTRNDFVALVVSWGTGFNPHLMPARRDNICDNLPLYLDVTVKTRFGVLVRVKIKEILFVRRSDSIKKFGSCFT